MANSAKWETKEISVVTPSDLDQLISVFNELAEPLNSYLNTLYGSLSTAKGFLVDEINPPLQTVIFVTDQILDFIESLKNSGIYTIVIYPSPATRSHFIKYRDVLPGFSADVDKGFNTLNTQDCLRYLYNSFDDVGDDERPPLDDNYKAGGIVIFAGSLTKDNLIAGSILKDIFELYKDIAEFFIDFFNLDQYRTLYRSLLKKIEDVNLGEQAYNKGETESDIIDRPSVLPDWQAKKFTRDVVPPLGDLLNNLEGIVQGFKDQAKGNAAIVQELIDFIDSKIEEINTVKDQINEFRTYLEDLNSKLNELTKFQFSVLTVEPQQGGIDKLRSALIDPNAANRPSDDFQFCTLTCMIGAGVGFSLLLNLLGLSDSVDLTPSNAELEEDNTRTRLDI